MLHALEVAPFARRQGLGRGMTRAVAAWALAAGAATLALAVTRANAPARALYDRLGMPDGGRIPLPRRPHDMMRPAAGSDRGCWPRCGNRYTKPRGRRSSSIRHPDPR